MAINLFQHIAAAGLDAFITPKTDRHLNEFINNSENMVQKLSGFTGSAGTAVDFRNVRFLLTDGRYYLQAKNELKEYKLAKKDDNSLFSLIEEHGAKKVGIDPRLISYSDYNKLKEQLIYIGTELVDVNNLYTDLGLAEEYKNLSKITDLENFQYSKDRTSALNKLIGDTINNKSSSENITGSTRAEKLSKVKSLLHEEDGILITELDTIAWLFNLRGMDIDYNLLFYAYAYISKTNILLFVNSDIKIPGVELRKYNNFESFLASLNNKSVLVSGGCNAFIGKQLGKVRFTNEIRKMQSIKTDAELIGILNANILDGVALMEVLGWIEHSETPGEQEIAIRLRNEKVKIGAFARESFDTIVGIGKNSAEIHHTPAGVIKADIKKTEDVKQKDSAIILIDSGSQYYFGTTDLTRTVCVKPTDEQKKRYTQVLKGVIAGKLFASKQISGKKLDEIVREKVNEGGFDYNTGTGHGVGAGLLVHEAPPEIGGDEEMIAEQQVFTIEPGYYAEGEYGIRIEDMVVMRNGKIMDLTYIPYHLKLIDYSMLEKKEKEYLNMHNKLIVEVMGPYLKKDSNAWRYLTENTKLII